MKKICLVLPSLAGGGMERVMIELSAYIFNQKNDEVFFVLLGKSKWFYSPKQGINVYEPDFIFENQNRMIFALKTAMYFRKQISRLKPDVILSFGEFWNNFVLLSLIGMKISVFISDRCNPSKSLGVFHDTLRKILYPTAKGIIAQTEKAREIFKEMGLNKDIRVIGNPIRSINIPGDIQREKIILSVGRLIRSKNMDRLIEIFDRINDPLWQLIIIGGDVKGGNNFESLQNKVKTLKSCTRIQLLGQIKNVDEYYNKSSIFAFMSVSEGFPNVVGEAMSSGLPVIAYDCIAGPSELIEDGINGFLINVNDEEEYEKKLMELMEKSKLRLQFGIESKKIIQKFSSENICKKFYDLLTEKA